MQYRKYNIRNYMVRGQVLKVGAPIDLSAINFDTVGWSQCPRAYMALCSLLPDLQIGSILVATLSSDNALLGVNCVNCSNYMFSDICQQFNNG